LAISGRYSLWAAHADIYIMDIYPLILAILREARSQGVAPMLKTTLVKFIYLLDVYTAEESSGLPVSGIEWRFLHFGPFSAQITTALDEMSIQRMIFADHREAQESDKEFVLYDLSSSQRAGDLRQIGIQGSIQLRLQADIKRYAKDLPRLLDYVYFRTSPMANAEPGDVLDFSGCRKMVPEDLRTVQMNKLRPKARKKAREKLRELIKARKSQGKVEQGPYDEAYFSALNMLDEEPLEIGLAGSAKLKI
jgi:hypothetical protein